MSIAHAYPDRDANPESYPHTYAHSTANTYSYSNPYSHTPSIPNTDPECNTAASAASADSRGYSAASPKSTASTVGY